MVSGKICLKDVVCKKIDKYGQYIINLSEEHYKRLEKSYGDEQYDSVCFNTFLVKDKPYYNMKIKKDRVYCEEFESHMGKRIDLYVTMFKWEFNGKYGVSCAVDLTELCPVQKKIVNKDDYLLE